MIFHDFKIRGINLRPEAAQTIIIISSNEPPGILPAFPEFLPEIKKSVIQTRPTSCTGGRDYGSFNNVTNLLRWIGRIVRELGSLSLL